MSKNTTAIAILIIALFLTATFAVTVPFGSAEDRYYTSYIYVATGTGDRPTTLGDSVLLVAWTADMPPDIGELSGYVSSPSGRAGWYDMQIKVWTPSNETEILDMPYSDPVGANYISYTPTEVGTYRIQALFPLTEKTILVGIVSGGSTYETGDTYTYSAAESPIATFEVVEEAQPKWVESPLVGAYWTRPLNDAAREWYVLAGNWLGGDANEYPPGSAGGNISPYAYGDAPESAHIIWSKPFYIGGIMDERYGDINFATAHYQGTQFSPGPIVDGKIHWTPYVTHAGSKGWQIIDLYSGETLFTDYEATRPSMATNYLYESPNQHGGFAYLWDTGGGGGFFFGGGGTPVQVPEIIKVGNTYQEYAGQLPIRKATYSEINTTETPISLGTVWRMIDAHTLNTVCYIANVSTSGTRVIGKDGSILYYSTTNLGTSDAPNYYCRVWNASAGTMVASHSGTGSWQWRPAGGDFGAENPYFGAPFFSSFSQDYNIVHDGNQMWWQNFSIPNISGSSVSIQTIREGEEMIVGRVGSNTPAGVDQGWMMGISLAEDNKGQQLWKSTFTTPFVDTTKNITVAGMFTGGFALDGVYPEEGIMVFEESKQLKLWVYDLKTGQQLWETQPGDISQYYFYSEGVRVYNGLVIVCGGYTGELKAFNATTGEVEWVYDAEGIGDESPYGNYPVGDLVISDDKIYTASWEHSYTHPIVRGYTLKCVNLTDGTEIWGGLDWGTGMAIADGILVESNSLDNMIYAYGRGPSATTVTASPGASVHGSSVMITGTVTDQTPTGRRNTNDLLDWTLKGTPAISDKDMARWMAYKYMSQKKPTDAQGVEVILTVLDPNGNVYEIGNTISDVEGNYGMAFTPEVPGTYQIFATFKGSRAYGPSADITYITVDEAPQASPTPTPAPPYGQTADSTILPATIGIIIAIVVIGAVIIMMLRKR
jgi:outer membrane protein assembly factor BamB